MTHEDLDLMADVVEETTVILKEKNLLPSPRAEFLVSRFLEYGIRRRRVSEVATLLGLSPRALTRELDKLGLPPAIRLMDLGASLCLARSCIENNRNMTATGKRFDTNVFRAGALLERSFGVRIKGLRGKTWEELLELFLASKWPEVEKDGVA